MITANITPKRALLDEIISFMRRGSRAITDGQSAEERGLLAALADLQTFLVFVQNADVAEVPALRTAWDTHTRRG